MRLRIVADRYVDEQFETGAKGCQSCTSTPTSCTRLYSSFIGSSPRWWRWGGRHVSSSSSDPRPFKRSLRGGIERIHSCWISTRLSGWET
jgi:hypothetical protein